MTTFGKYRLIAELGRGGMANVFLAVTRGITGIQFNKLVVLKRLRDHVASDPEFVTMLMDEGRLAARLNHPNVVQTLEVDKHDDELFIAMEYLEGQPLHRVLARSRQSFPLAIHLTILVDVLAGIHHAHELADFDGTPLNVVHRDVTPHNIFVTYNGQVKVVDFGIAKAEGRASETKHGVVKGKVMYMAPEQARGLVVDRRTDLFAVGVMLYEACVRGRLWQGKQDHEVVRALLRETHPQSPRDIDPDVHVELDRICRRALSADLNERYQTAEEFTHDLEAFMKIHAPRPSNRELGAWIADRFQDKRELTKKVIEQQLADLKENKAAPVVAIPVENAPQESTAAESSVARTRVMTEEELKSTMKSAVGPVPTTNRPSKRRVAALVALAVLAVGIMAIAVRARVDGRSTPVAEAATKVTVRLQATPESARFVIDDGAPLSNPYVGTFEKDVREHTTTASAPGYESRSRAVRFSDDVSVQFGLARGLVPPRN